MLLAVLGDCCLVGDAWRMRQFADNDADANLCVISFWIVAMMET